MRYEATIVLEIMRKANEEHVSIKGDAWGIILDTLHITEDEKIELGEIMQADLREKYASSPAFGKVCDVLNWIKP